MLLVTLSIITIILLNGKKEIKLDNVSLNEIDEYSGLAFLIEQTDGTYEKSENNDWPTEGYKLNQRLSGCVDNNGNTINKAVKYEYGTLKVKTRVNASCYLYFDRRKAATEELINTVSSEQLWDSTLEEDGYRYVGTNPDNYICFGTTDQDECTSDTNKYMYRIIGIFEDNESVQHLKLIKKEALNTTYAWHNDNTVDVNWDESDLYKGINGSYFATNSEYSYMQDSVWNNIITTWEYTSTNTKSYENYVLNNVYGPNYYYQDLKTTYLHEMNRSSKSNQTCYYSENQAASCNVGIWNKLKSKISLMYVSDYQLSLGLIALDYKNNDVQNFDSMKTGWMHISNSDNNKFERYEWTMTSHGGGDGQYDSLGVSDGGSVSHYRVNNILYARPVFYLEENVELKEGYGTISEPYMISQETAVEKILATVPEEQLWDSTLEDDGYRYVGTNPDNYICFGTTDQEECMNNSDKYMYRIIGIFEDSERKQHLKLIKKEALNTAYAWHNDNTTDTDWDASDLYKGLNGSYFATNADYSYMQDSAWNNLITTWSYIATNTLTYGGSGPNYYNSVTVENIYLHEMNRSSKTSIVGEWKYATDKEWDKSVVPNVKVGLLYVSDYLLSLGNSVLAYKSYDNRMTLKTGWMHISNNDSGAPSENEWTSTRSGTDGYTYAAWRVGSGGDVGGGNLFSGLISVRPVFYLESDTKLDKGKGTLNNPYTIETSPNLREYCEEYNNINECIQNEENNIEEVSDLWNSTLEEDGIRYVGTNPNNYVCFGTIDTSECTSDTDKYMYRIIGIFEDSEGVQHLKLIKKEALNATYMWHNVANADVDWDASDLYKGLNGISGGYYNNLFVGNSAYSYMSISNNWYNKIIEWNYTATNTLTYEKNGPDYYNSLSIKNIYLHEMNSNSKNTSIGEWKTVSSKIGLMYINDYVLSLGNNILNYTADKYSDALKNGWMHFSNNDKSMADKNYEWSMTRLGYYANNEYIASLIDYAGRVNAYGIYQSVSVRPVFYLTENIKITSGKGSITEPFIIN